jgi:hypothetical protein
MYFLLFFCFIAMKMWRKCAESSNVVLPTPQSYDHFIWPTVDPIVCFYTLRLDKMSVGQMVFDQKTGSAKDDFKIATWAQCYKTFYVRNLRRFVIS